MDDTHITVDFSQATEKKLYKIAQSTTHSIWQIKRAKIILASNKGKTIKQLVTLVRVPPESVEKCLISFIEKGLSYLNSPIRKPTQREKKAESLLVLLNKPDACQSPDWTELKVNYIGCEFNAQNIYQLRQYIDLNPTASRKKIAETLCSMFNLTRKNGQAKHATAYHIVKRMGMDNIIQLPEPITFNRNITAAKSPESTDVQGKKIQEKEVPAKTYSIQAPPGYAEKTLEFSSKEIKNLHFILTDSRERRNVWREAIERFHYIGTTGLFGAQLKYLIYGSIKSDDNEYDTILLGVLGFAASTWRLASRDKFIGLTDKQREKNLQLVINNARFLILPWIKSKNLASRMLGKITRQLADDWQKHFHYRPLLVETFVELDRFKGTCYKASNWQEIGTTNGYSLSIRKRKQILKKAVFVYPLCKNYKQLLCNN